MRPIGKAIYFSFLTTLVIFPIIWYIDVPNKYPMEGIALIALMSLVGLIAIYKS